MNLKIKFNVLNRSLQLRVIAAAYFLILLFMGLIMYRTYNEALVLIKDQFSNHQMSVAKQTALEIERSISSLVKGLYSLSEVLGSPALTPEADRQLMAKEFEYVKRHYVNDLALIDSDGVIKVSLASPHIEGVNHSFKSFFKKVKALNQPGVAFEFIPLTGIQLGQKGIIIAFPVYKGFDFQGAVYFTVHVSELIHSFLPLELMGSNSCVVNDRGEYLCNPRLLKDSLKAEAQHPKDSLGALTTNLETTNIFFDPVQTPVQEKVITVTYPVKIADQTWSIRISTPEEILQNLLSPFSKNFALIALSLLFLIVGTSLFFLRMATRLNIELGDELEKEKVELLTSREKHSAILATINEMIWEIDTEGRYVYVSPTSTNILGYSPEELLGTTIYDLMPEEDVRKFKKSLSLVIQNRTKFSGLQRKTMNRKGREIIFETNGSLIFNSDGSVTGIRGADRDISKRKKAEDELRKYAIELEEIRSNLEERVEERTTELKKAHAMLINKEKFAAIGELASSVSHELRNPLGVIKNSVYFFNIKMNSFKDEAVKENIKIITREIEHANKIITELLDFTRNKAPVRLDVDINQLTREILERPVIPDNVRVVTDLTAPTPKLSVDPTQVAQTFINLVENAIQSMEKTGGTLRVSTELKDGLCKVVFADTGCGILPKDLEHIFSPLFTTKTKGIGLGLSIAKSMAVANGAEITAESTPGQGSTFTVSFKI